MERRSEMQRVAVLRETMIRQEVMFKEQVRELHRLYQKQKILMTGFTKLKAAELGTMDLLQCLNREEQQQHHHQQQQEQVEMESHGIRVKRQKTLDLEQLPDDNDEDTEYIYEQPRESIALGLSKGNSTLDFREHPPTLSLFPIPNTPPQPLPNPSSMEQVHQGCLGRTSDQIPLPYNSTLREPWWKSFGQDGARLIGQIVRECQQQDGRLLVTNSSSSSSYHPYGSLGEGSVSNLFLNANSNRNGQVLEPLQNHRGGYNNNPWQHQHMASLAYSFNFKESLAPPPLLSPPPPRPTSTTFNGFSLEANRISWCSGNNFMLPGNNMKPPAPLPLPVPVPCPFPFPDKALVPASAVVPAVVRDGKVSDGAMKASEDAKPPAVLAPDLVSSQEVEETGGTGTSDRIVNRLLGASCTDTDSTADASVDSDKQVIDLNKSICSNNNNRDVDTLVNNDTITWAATILLSLAPDNCKCSSQLSRVHESISLLSADVKLFKSVVIMLKQSGGKASKKLVVKSFNHGKGGVTGGGGGTNHGTKAAAAAATLLETLKKSVGQDKEEAERVSKQQGKQDKAKAVSRSSSNGKKKSFTSWMWGDVTRKKRMQRHRSNHSQQVQQVRCL